MHCESHRLAGKVVRIRYHPETMFSGAMYKIIDWYDLYIGEPWHASYKCVPCMSYAIRRADNGLPLDDNVLYGEIVGVINQPHLIHECEIYEIVQDAA